MIADTTFVSDFTQEHRRGILGPARSFLAQHRAIPIRTTIVTVTELAVLFPTSAAAWEWLAKWKIYGLHRGIADAAADIDRVLISSGQRLGENDTWIAGFAAYYREPLLSHDAAFDRAPGVRRQAYQRPEPV
jgi:predicted nucleic acid-binding protein